MIEQSSIRQPVTADGPLRGPLAASDLDSLVEIDGEQTVGGVDLARLHYLPRVGLVSGRIGSSEPPIS